MVKMIYFILCVFYYNKTLERERMENDYMLASHMTKRAINETRGYNLLQGGSVISGNTSTFSQALLGCKS